MAKKLIMSDYELKQTFNHFKDDRKIQNALENGYLIYLRPNGFMVINPNVKITKKLQKVLDTQYILYN